MAKSNYDIQGLVTETGVPRRNIYFYVQQGILPPPQGAGLAAHYTEDHLLRLQLIPVMRGQGLRLDEIRERFKSMSVDEMRQTLDTVRQAQEAALKKEAEANHLRNDKPHGYIPSYVPAPGIAPSLPHEPLWSEQRQTQYRLPGGVTISVPESLNPVERQRVELLLQAARQIFSGGVPTFVSISSQSPAQPNDPPGPNIGDEPSA